MPTLIKLIKRTYRMVEPHESRMVMNNVAFLSGLQAVTYLLPLILIPYLFRTVGPAKFGLIAFAQAFVQYFMILTDYGFSVSATKEISLCHDNKEEINKVFASVMTIKTILLLVSFLILALVVYFVPKFREDWMIYAISFGAVVGNTLFPVWFFQGTEKMKYIARLNIIGEFVFAFGIFLFVRGPQDYLMAPLVNSAVFLLTGILGQIVLFSKFGISFRLPDLTDLRHQLKAGWNIFISVVAINAYTTTRVFAVGLLTNNTTTGFYSIAERIANAVQTFPLSSFSQALFPRLSKIFHKNKAKAVKIAQQVQSITIIISAVCLPVFFFLSPFIVRVVCGGEYPAVVLSLRLLLVSVFFVASNAFRAQFLLVCGRTDIYSRIHITMALIGLPLIIMLISAFSYVGAAAATVAIEGGICLVTYFIIRKLKV